MPEKSKVFVHSDSSDCAAVTPDKDVGAGHAMFTITKTGGKVVPCAWIYIICNYTYYILNIYIYIYGICSCHYMYYLHNLIKFGACKFILCSLIELLLWPTVAGDYTLCYRVTGAKDSVAQSADGVKLQAVFGVPKYVWLKFINPIVG